MAISIKDPETDRLARELAAMTGESLTDAIREALRDRLARASRGRPADGADRLGVALARRSVHPPFVALIQRRD